MRIVYAGMALAALAMTPSRGAAARDLEGLWGAPGATLTIGPEGGLIRQDCGEGRFGPVRLDSSHSFKADGTWEDFGPGPQPADVAPRSVKVVFEGRVQDQTLTLTVRRLGAPAHSFTFLKGQRAKLIRCL